ETGAVGTVRVADVLYRTHRSIALDNAAFETVPAPHRKEIGADRRNRANETESDRKRRSNQLPIRANALSEDRLIRSGNRVRWRVQNQELRSIPSDGRAQRRRNERKP